MGQFFSTPFLQNVFFISTGIAAVFGGIGVVAAFLSAISGYVVTDRVQKDADVRIAEATTQGEEAKKDAARANEAAGKANERAASLEAEAQELRAANLAFEQALSPRLLEQSRTGSNLKQFSDVAVTVYAPPELEPRRTAGQIRYMLRGIAGWKKFTGALPPEPFFDGVVIHANGQRARQAADVLTTELKANGIESRLGYPMPELGDNAVRVVVGLKPLPPALQPNFDALPGDERNNKVYGNVLEDE